MKILLRIAAIAPFLVPCIAGAGEGEIIILREVSPRVAYRESQPGPVISKANASPRQQVLDALDGAASGRELSDDEFALVGTGKPAGGGNSPIAAISGTLGAAGASGGGTTAPGGASGVLGGMNALIGAAGGGTVGRATQDIGKTVNSMVGSMPAGVTQ